MYILVIKSVKALLKNLSIALFAFLTCTITVIVVLILESLLNFSIYSLSLWFIFPVGAIMTSIAAASGYYWGAKKFNIKPNRTLLLNMLLASVYAFYLIYYLSYIGYEVDGQAISEVVSFSDYINTVLTKSHYEIGFKYGTVKTDIGELGQFGYLVGLSQILGFAAGGLLTYRFLKKQVYCDRCNKYAGSGKTKVKFFSDENDLNEFYKDVLEKITKGYLQKVINLHGDKDNSKNEVYSSNIDAKICPKCRRYFIKYYLMYYDGNSWKLVPDSEFKLHSDEKLIF